MGQDGVSAIFRLGHFGVPRLLPEGGVDLLEQVVLLGLLRCHLDQRVQENGPHVVHQLPGQLLLERPESETRLLPYIMAGFLRLLQDGGGFVQNAFLQVFQELGTFLDAVLHLFPDGVRIGLDGFLDFLQEFDELVDGFLDLVQRRVRPLLQLSLEEGDQIVDEGADTAEVGDVGIESLDQRVDPGHQGGGVVIVLDRELLREITGGIREHPGDTRPAEDIDFHRRTLLTDGGHRILDEGVGVGDFAVDAVLKSLGKVSVQLGEVGRGNFGGVLDELRHFDGLLSDEPQEVQHLIDPVQNLADPAEISKGFMQQFVQFAPDPIVFRQQFVTGVRSRLENLFLQFFEFVLEFLDLIFDSFPDLLSGLADEILQLLRILRHFPDLFVEDCLRIAEQDDEDMVEKPLRELLVKEGILHERTERDGLPADRIPLQGAELPDQVEQVREEVEQGLQLSASHVTERHGRRKTAFLNLILVLLPLADREQTVKRELGRAVLSLLLHDADVVPVNPFVSKILDGGPDRVHRGEDGRNQIVQFLVVLEVGQIITQPFEDMADECRQGPLGGRQLAFQLVIRLRDFGRRGGEIGRKVSEEILEQRVLGHR